MRRSTDTTRSRRSSTTRRSRGTRRTSAHAGDGGAEAARPHRLARDDIAVWEINEAFSAVAITSARNLGLDEASINQYGGAVAMGHPIGASGARIIGTVINQLRKRGGGFGIAAICSGGGQGDAVLVKVG